MEKDYQRAVEFTRVIQSKNKPMRGFLSAEDQGIYSTVCHLTGFLLKCLVYYVIFGQ